MYRAFYQLQKAVNCKSIAVGELFSSAGFKEALARLDYMKDKGGFVLVSGQPGVGKTTLLRGFVESLDSKFFKVAYAPLATVSVSDFYRQLAYLLSGQILYRKDILFRTIQQTIMEMAVNKKTIPIIIFDDAHFLKNENFFELQLLSNFNFDSLSPALFILIAQPHLQERLRRPAFDSFYQRISIKINLQSLSCQETRNFIVQVLKNAAGINANADADAGFSRQTSIASSSISRYENLFTPPACELIFKRSGGIPRLIATIMEQALIYGSAHQLETLDENVIYHIEPEL
jgi:type II secretory pathway predicted ATPase ExeA